MNYLFNDSISPMTSCIGFLEIDPEAAVSAYEDWMSPILKDYGFHLKKESIYENLRDTILKLLPLVSPIRTKFLFIPTNSGWTAFFDNGWQGSDASTPMQILSERLKCNGVAVTAVPHTLPSVVKQNTKGRYGATIFEAYGPGGDVIRTVYSSNDGGRWTFGESGVPFKFENSAAYRARRIQDRFTPEILEKYLQELGIDAFKEGYYRPDEFNGSILLIKKGKYPANFKEYTLPEVRASIGEKCF